MELLVLMSLPLAGALLLALLGERRHAAELNVLVSLGTFIAGCALTAGSSDSRWPSRPCSSRAAAFSCAA